MDMAVQLFKKRWVKHDGITLNNIYFMFIEAGKIYRDELSYDFEDKIDEFFCMDCDDGSIDQVVDSLIYIYEHCKMGDIQEINNMIKEQPADLHTSVMKSVLNHMEESDDEEEEEEEVDDEEGESVEGEMDEI